MRLRARAAACERTKMETPKHTILLVDDENEIRNMLRIFLDVEDYNVLEAEDGKTALQKVISDKPSLVVLDLGLPDMDGQDVLAKIRQFSHVPVIVLTARDDDTQLVKALTAGADDYVTKPFRAEVLLARIGANLRGHSAGTVESEALTNGGIRLDLHRHEVFINDQLVAFTPKEFSLLGFFVRNKGKMLTHKQILKDIWGSNHTDDTQYLRVYIGQVRSKLEGAGNLANAIVSESGIGYRMDILDRSLGHAPAPTTPDLP